MDTILFLIAYIVLIVVVLSQWFEIRKINSDIASLDKEMYLIKAVIDMIINTYNKKTDKSK